MKWLLTVMVRSGKVIMMMMAIVVCALTYVMEYGNYGYTDEMTGAGWRANRTNIEDSIPFRHWHLNDPGVVPNLLQTGAGSPTGIISV